MTALSSHFPFSSKIPFSIEMIRSSPSILDFMSDILFLAPCNVCSPTGCSPTPESASYPSTSSESPMKEYAFFTASTFNLF